MYLLSFEDFELLVEQFVFLNYLHILLGHLHIAHDGL